MPSPRQPVLLDRQGASVRFDAGLVEEAVLLAVERVEPEERRRFRSERDPLYELDDPDGREQRFHELHAGWFVRLGLAKPLLALLAEQPSIAPEIAACLVVPATHGKDEHADLHEPRRSRTAGDPAGRPVLAIHLRPATLIDKERLEPMLRRELFYIADMLDPEFGYDPESAIDQTAGPLASVLRQRHELLWRIVVDGRLAARGDLSETELARRQSQFRSAFPMLADGWVDAFERLFEGPRPSSQDLMALALEPAGPGAGGGCPLCRMPVPRLRLQRQDLPEAAVRGARRDSSEWRPEDGMCPQCMDRYELEARASRRARSV